MTLHVSTFAGASSLPLYVAAEQGMFARAGIEVEFVATRSSDELMSGLLDGGFEIVHAAPDNFVAWRDRTGAPIVAWIGGSSGPIVLVGRPGITSVADLAGRTIAVDSLSSGFVSALRKILRTAGVDPASVVLDPLGATHLRAAALREGRTDASMLTLPWSAAAAREGLPVLADSRAAMPRLQGSCGGSLQPWLEAHEGEADGYLRAIVAALTWLSQPSNHESARALLEQRYGIEPELAETVRAAFTDPATGWPASAAIDLIGVEAVLELRAENGAPAREPTAAYLDLRPYRRVLGFGLLDG
jgi:NitT/TauT family transport system substrate-binding protein